jgi:Xaa-Pro aminopeptidase
MNSTFPFVVSSLTRIDALKDMAFSNGDFNGYLVLNNYNLLYFLGFPGTSAMLIPADGKCSVYVYGVNFEQAKTCGKAFNVELVRGDENLMTKISAQAKNFKVKKLFVDTLGVESWRSLTKEFSDEIGLEIGKNHIQLLRTVKDNFEIELMRKAGELTSEGMRVAYEMVKAGAKEHEVAAEIEYAMRKRGSGPTAFDSIVASGGSSAFPHGGCSDREIRDGDLVIVDIGATYSYYCSDMTRTIVAGKPSEKQRKIYDIVKTAQQRAFEAIKTGAVVGDLDAIARRLIADAGYGPYFVHRLGHGVGLEVHESPSMGPNGKDQLSAGYVVTDEPGIYIPGFGGVRIEDTVLVGKSGAERLTIGPYNLHD